MRDDNSLPAIFEELKNALIACDVNRLEEIISDDYEGFSLHGTIETKENILQTFQPGNLVLTEYTTRNINYESANDFGIVSGKGCIAGSYGENAFKHEVLFIDIFKYIDDQWKYYKSQVTEISSTR